MSAFHLAAFSFRGNQGPPLGVLSQEVAFLVTVTSARRVSDLAALPGREPYGIHKDTFFLRPRPSFFLPKVSSFHLNEDIVFPSLCPRPAHHLEASLLCWLGSGLFGLLASTASCLLWNPFFCISCGPRRVRWHLPLPSPDGFAW